AVADRVAARTADEQVVAGARGDRVGRTVGRIGGRDRGEIREPPVRRGEGDDAVVAEDEVARGRAHGDRVGAGAAEDDVAAGAAGDRVGSGVSRRDRADVDDVAAGQ